MGKEMGGKVVRTHGTVDLGLAAHSGHLSHSEGCVARVELGGVDVAQVSVHTFLTLARLVSVGEQGAADGEMLREVVEGSMLGGRKSGTRALDGGRRGGGVRGSATKCRPHELGGLTV